MRKVIMLFCLMVSMSVCAQDFGIVRDACTPGQDEYDGAAGGRAKVARRLPAIYNTWNPDKVYKQLVILITFKGDNTNFAMENPREAYDQMLNGKGYSQRNGKGCVADYFRDQSDGLFNLQLDVYGPYQVNQKAQPYDNPDSKTRNYGREALVEATRLFLAENPDIDFSQYDWNNDGKVNQVMYIYAGYAGNVNSEVVYGHIWPNTSTFTTITTPDGKRITNYTCSGELWPNNASCGIGTICHEFTHSLGLPDIYPTSDNAGYSVCDEWDLMDGGNFTNYGWCPPNYTAMEKMLLGWLEPVELTEPASISGMKPVEEGGEVYKITHSESEFLLLENRQQHGWDLGAPGKGLVIYHVYYDKAVWSGNTVNNNQDKRRFELIHADNMDYDDWYDYLVENNLKTYVAGQRMNSRFLSTSPYPWTTDSTDFVNNQLTETSVPPAKMNYPNGEGLMKFDKPITNIQMSDDGLISFDFMGGSDVSVLTAVCEQIPGCPRQSFDLTGRQVQPSSHANLYIIREADGRVRKVFR